jgi:hypothetical protein
VGNCQNLVRTRSVSPVTCHYFQLITTGGGRGRPGPETAPPLLRSGPRSSTWRPSSGGVVTMPRIGPNWAGVFAPNELVPVSSLLAKSTMILALNGSWMSGVLNRSQNWRKLAGDARRHAAGIQDGGSKQAILHIADGYEFLAQQTNDRAEEDRQLRCYGASGEDNGTIVAPANQRSAPCHS